MRSPKCGAADLTATRRYRDHLAAIAMRRVSLIRTLAGLVVLLAMAIEAGDYVVRARHGGASALWPWRGVYLFADVSSTLRTFAIAVIATLLLTRARERMSIALAGLVFALYAAVSAVAFLGDEVRSHTGVALLTPLFIAALNLAATRYFQLFPDPVTRLPLNRVLAFLMRPLPLVLLASVPLLGLFVPGLRGVIVGLWGVAIMFLQFAYLRLNLNADPEYRQRFFWVAEGLLLILFTNVFYPLGRHCRTSRTPRSIPGPRYGSLMR